MNTPSPVSLNRRWAMALTQDSARVAHDLLTLGLSPHDVIDGEVRQTTHGAGVIRSKSLWRWAARAPGYLALQALVPGVAAQWAMRPDDRQTAFVSGFEQPVHQQPTLVVRLHTASVTAGGLPSRVDGWALDEALHWEGDATVHKLVWLNQQLHTWASTMAWDPKTPAPWGGSVGDRAEFLSRGWRHALLTAGDAGAWSLLAFERLGIVPEGQWDRPMRAEDAGPSTTLMQDAARLAQPDLVRSLLDQNADPNLATVDGYTPLGFVTAHLVQAPEQKLPDLVAAWIDLLNAGALLDTPLPATSTRAAALYRPQHGDWLEQAPNNQWANRTVADTVQAWIRAQRANDLSAAPDGSVDGFRRTQESRTLAGRVARALEAQELRRTWAEEEESEIEPSPSVSPPSFGSQP